ncbi:MAG: hypothetical protein ACTIJJ_04485 [Galactobacter sp.]
MDAETLLNGPRGRGLCLAAVEAAWDESETKVAADGRDALFRIGAALERDDGVGVFFGFEDDDGKPLSKCEARSARKQMLKGLAADKADPSELLSTLTRCIEATEFPAPARADLVTFLARQVDSARYWQHPEGADYAAETPQVRRALEGVARQLAPLCAWMDAPLDRDQAWTTSEDGERDEHAFTGVAAGLAKARTAVREDEGRHRSARNPAKEVRGNWWSGLGHPPVTTGLTGSDDRPGPLRLYCEEDGYRASDEQIIARRLQVKDSDRVLEILTAQDWAVLCATHPLPVTKSYRGCWADATGRDSLHPEDGTDPGWVIPDLAAAAEEYDGIHLTLAAYLACSGTAIPVPPSHGHTNGAAVIAGWNPDETVWLSDRTVLDTQRWVEDAEAEDFAYCRTS